MSTSVSMQRGNLFGRAIVAGIIGGILIDLFLFITKSAPFPGAYQYIASGMVGQAAYTSNSYIAIGIVLHFVISIVGALAYAYIGSTMKLLSRWVLGGILLGIVMLFVMQGVLHMRGIAPPATTQGFVMGFIAHILFYGLPIAWYIARGTATSRVSA